MKVTSKKTNYIIAIAIIYTTLLGFTTFLSLFGQRPLSGIVKYVIILAREGAYLVSIFYLAQVLTYLNEQKHIIVTFNVYIFFNLFVYLVTLTIIPSLFAIYAIAAIGGLAAKIYFIIQLFRINNEAIGKYFKMLGRVMILSLFFKLIESLLKIQHWQRKPINPYIFLSELLPALVIIFILYKTTIYLNHQQQSLHLTAADSNKPA